MHEDNERLMQLWTAHPAGQGDRGTSYRVTDGAMGTGIHIRQREKTDERGYIRSDELQPEGKSR